MRIRHWSVLAVAVGVGLLAAATPTTAYATNWVGWTGNYGCSYNSGLNATYSTNYLARLSALLPQVASATKFALNTVVDPTDMNVSITTSTTVVPSVDYHDADYSSLCGYSFDPVGTVIGLTICESLTLGVRCRTHEIYFDNSFTNATDDFTRRAIAVHETGHSLGLAHRDNDVMQAMLPVPTYYFSAHDLAHINGNY